MKNKYIVNFWVGFLMASVATAIIYWLLREKRQITPAPVILKQEEKKWAVPSNLAPRLETTSDDLTRIKGIGPATAHLLNENGIHSFKDLAHAEPAKIEEIMGTTRWDPADWVKEAAEILSGG